MGSGTVADWRHRNRHFLTGARLVIAPSHDTGRRIAGFAPGARVRTIAHTDLAEAGTAALPAAQPRPVPVGTPLKIVVLGALSAIKGADILEAAALDAAQGAPIRISFARLRLPPPADPTTRTAHRAWPIPRRRSSWLAGLAATRHRVVSCTVARDLQLHAQCCLAGGPSGRCSRHRHSRSAYPGEAGVGWCPGNAVEGSGWIFFLRIKTEHFTSASPPSEAPAVSVSPPNADWTYRRDYIHPPSQEDQPIRASLDAETARQYLPVHFTAAATRRGILGVLLYLRSLPLLRSVVRRIPANWQKRVKDRLQK